MKKFLLLISVACLSATIIKAQWTSDTTQNTVVHDTAGATVPLVTSGPDGSSYITWFESIAGNYDLHMQRLDSNGYKMWAPEGIVVSNQTQNSALFRYDLKTDNSGKAIVAFQDMRTGVLNVVAYLIDPTGSSLWGTGIVLIDSASDEGIAPVIGVTSENEVVIAWSCDSTGNKWIAAQKIASGIPMWNPLYRQIDSTGVLKYSRPQLLRYGSGNVMMMYVEETGTFPGVTSTLYAQPIGSGANNIWPTPVQVSTNTIPFFIFPVPVPDNAGGFFVAFNTSNPVNTFLNDVYVQHVDSMGNLWSATGTEAANSTVNQKTTNAGCYVSSSGNFWVLIRVQDGGQSTGGISVQKFDSAGGVLLGPDGLVIIPLDPANYDPATINDATDGVILSSSYGSFGTEHIIAIKLDYSGVPLWTNTTISICAVNSNKDDLQSRDYYNSNLVFVWQDDRTGSGIFAQNIYSDGTTGLINGIKNVHTQNRFSLFPNPSAFPEITLSDNNHSDKLIEVKDYQGRMLISKIIAGNETKYVLNETNAIPNGIYFVSIGDSKGTETFRWIKQ